MMSHILKGLFLPGGRWDADFENSVQQHAIFAERSWEQSFFFSGREKAWESGVLGIKTKVLKMQWLLHMFSLMVVSAELEQMARKKRLQITIHVTLFSRI